MQHRLKIQKARPSISKKASAAVTNTGNKMYNTDYYGWAYSQAKALRNGGLEKLDIENLIEEIESLGKSEKSKLDSYVEVLLMHMLKAKYQPEMHTRSWDLSIKASKLQMHKVLRDNPSLKPELKEILKDAYEMAKIKASLETNLKESTFPEKCPWKVQEIFEKLEKKYW